ncbi:hypothetical protein BOX15_Mlig017053g1 [Macrostomum lignano]|uniref:Cadherin domain-containing protein n=1 Tax=Macrostomum lignano TaxID=282301 RepID=A0A267GS00_9PLAT|nr:hypothetical protein BOX15_Mlig017053g1 [Macrostomum lignano]
MLQNCITLISTLWPILLAVSQDSQPTVTFYTKEEIPIGNEIGNLKTRFSYPDGSQFNMLFPDSEIRRLFRLDSRTGALSTIARLDREVLCPNKPLECLRTFNVEVKRGGTGQEEVIVIRLIINDVNDQRPKFEAKHKKFRISIPESDNPPSYYSLPTAEDGDSDRYDHVKYDLKMIGDAGMYFKLFLEERGSKRVPKLELTKALDRETKDNYELQLLVSDEQHPEDQDSADIQIEVLDANDNKPQWRLAKQSITISECDRLHRPLLKLNATDEDLNERITYSIGKAAGKDVAKSFYISGDKLKQNQSLDYEKIRKKVLYIPLVAEDRGGSTVETYVELRVTDCNDHYPNITVEMIEDKILENDETEKVLARILVVDEDEGNNGTVDCVIGVPNKRKFQLTNRITDGQYKTIYKLKKLAHVSFDREATSGGEVRVDIICTDKGDSPRVGRKEVKIMILDENDNAPRIESKLYTFRIHENSPPNTLVGRVTARDDDIDENARLKFSLHSDGSRNFVIRNQGNNMAEIYSAVSFDREQIDHYRFTVTVADSGLKEQRTSTATVEVTIVDEDDSVPTFQFREYMFRIEEDYGRNLSKRYIGEVKATDADIGANQMIWYEVNRQYQASLADVGISGMYFYFNGSHLYGEGNFDREKQEIINLEIFARNRGPAKHKGSARVTITLNDVNDNAPSIQGLQKVYNLSENSPAGTPVLQVSGTDLDAGENGTLTYILDETEANRFTIDGKHGIVTLSGSLKNNQPEDGFQSQTYRLGIGVRDNGNPPLHSIKYTTFVHVSSGQASEHGRRVNQATKPGNRAGGGGGQRGVEILKTDQNLLILLCLAAVVFIVFVALLVILLYVHARGRRTARNRTRHPGVWYDKANGDTVEEQPSEVATETGLGFYRFADNPNNPNGTGASPLSAAGNALGSIVRNKYPSFGYLSSIDKQRGGLSVGAYNGQHGAMDQQQQQQAKTYYETYGRGSDRLPRKATAFQQTTAAAAAVGTSSTSQTGRQTIENKEYSNLIGRVEENRYADHQRYQQQHQHPGYAMLAETPASLAAAGTSTAAKPADTVVCRTPYMTSSFV